MLALIFDLRWRSRPPQLRGADELTAAGAFRAYRDAAELSASH